jgi:uridine kinase
MGQGGQDERLSGFALGVAGGTGSGKTTVAQAILEAIGRDRISSLAQDSYYRDIEWESEEQFLKHNFDHPDAIDHRLLVEHLQMLKSGHDVEVPVYDFVTHRRTPATRTMPARPVILLEGILILASKRLRDLLDFKIFVDADADVRLMRRVRRDMSERGRDLQDIFRQYNSTVRPMHLEFVEPSKRWADVIVPQGGQNRVAVEMVIARLEQVLMVEDSV